MIWLALGIGSILAAALSMVTLFYLVPVFAVAAVICLMAAFHYFVWGWWMPRFLERSADHAVNIAERVYYVETGKLVQLAKSHAASS